MTNEIATIAKAAANKVGDIKMSRRSFLKIGLVSILGAYDVATDVTSAVSDKETDVVDQVG